MEYVHATVRGIDHAVEVLNPYINSLMGIVVIWFIVNQLLHHPELYSRKERCAMGITAGGMLMATPALWLLDTPFGPWTFNLARFGVVLYIIAGGVRRDRHAKRNAEAIHQAERHFARYRGN